ncbi:hypothetical protein [Aeromonas jandaei]|uniref:hypothetical protein n=1 Tax=Aeromonas jandaei TaxID=650 RepID=UPI0039870DD1
MAMFKKNDGSYVEAPFHQWFGLTYSSYLVLPRSVLEAMPFEWQERAIELLDEAREMLDTDAIPDNYCVQLRGDSGRFVRDQFANYRHPPMIPFKSNGGAA